jgi:hypothetical protein
VARNQVGFRPVLCAPAMPGKVLNRDTTQLLFVAPWWAPTATKATFHSMFCGQNRIPTRLDWIIEKTDSKMKVTNDEQVVWYKKLTSARVQSDRLVLQNQRGQVEEVLAVW